MFLKKKSILKTLNRRLKIVKVKSHRYTQGTFIPMVKVTKQNHFQHVRKTRSKYVKMEKCYIALPLFNTATVESCGYTPRKTKASKNALRVVKRNVRIDGWTCKERRLILHIQRKLHKAA